MTVLQFLDFNTIKTARGWPAVTMLTKKHFHFKHFRPWYSVLHTFVSPLSSSLILCFTYVCFTSIIVLDILFCFFFPHLFFPWFSVLHTFVSPQFSSLIFCFTYVCFTSIFVLDILFNIRLFHLYFRPWYSVLHTFVSPLLSSLTFCFTYYVCFTTIIIVLYIQFYIRRVHLYDKASRVLCKHGVHWSTLWRSDTQRFNCQPLSTEWEHLCSWDKSNIHSFRQKTHSSDQS